jgi:transformation/transcription domain-associated protein
VLEHQFHFLKALFFVMMDLTGEVSSGAVDLAKSNLDSMLMMCARKLEGENANEDMLYVQKKSFHDVTYELVRQVTSPNTTVREMVSKKTLNKTGKLPKIKTRKLPKIDAKHIFYPFGLHCY